MHYENMAYKEAIDLYTKALDSKENPAAKIKLAHSYWKLENYKMAEYWCGQVVQTSGSEPIYKLYYAHMLKRNGKLQEACIWYGNYLKIIPSDEEALAAYNALNSLLVIDDIKPFQSEESLVPLGAK